ncbi:hypothetical protein D3C75_653100 [compost metagenome]
MLTPKGIRRAKHFTAGLHPERVPIMLNEMPHSAWQNAACITRCRDTGPEGSSKGRSLHDFNFVAVPFQLIIMVEIRPGQMRMQINHSRTDP